MRAVYIVESEEDYVGIYESLEDAMTAMKNEARYQKNDIYMTRYDLDTKLRDGGKWYTYCTSCGDDIEGKFIWHRDDYKGLDYCEKCVQKRKERDEERRRLHNERDEESFSGEGG